MSRIPTLVACALTLAMATTAVAVDDHEPGTAGMPEMGRPAEMDKVSHLLGDWNVEMKMRMGPDAPWMSTEASATTKAILDGCVQRMDFHGSFMGAPMNGMDHLSYNRNRGQFESFWVDNMGANFSFMSGNFKGDALVLTGEMLYDGVTVQTRSTSTRQDDSTIAWSMEESHDGGQSWYESMRMTYTKK